MDSKEKKALSETDISDMFITPAIRDAGWDSMRQTRREVTLTPGPIIVSGNLSSRNKKKKKSADYLFFWEPNVPVAVVEAKDNKHTVSQGLQQALGYAGMSVGKLIDVSMFNHRNIGHKRNVRTTLLDYSNCN